MKAALAINEIYELDCFQFLSMVEDEIVDLAVIDPPYNLKKADWDTFDSGASFFEFTYTWIDSLIPKLKPNGSLYIFNTPYNSAFILQHLVSRGLFFQNWITWDKRDGMGGARRRFSNGQETILFFSKGKNHTFNFEDVRVPYESTARIAHAKKKGILKNGKRWYPNPNGRLCGEVWHFASERHKNKVNGRVQKLGHVTPKPLDMIERIIRASSNPGDLVLDCFVGTGTTAVAAKRLDRNFLCSDNNCNYVNLANSFLLTESRGVPMTTSYVSHIVPGNESLEFIDARLSDDGYRGIHISQHFRYNRDEMVAILRLLDKYAPSKSLLPIRTTDLTKRPNNLPDEETYSRFCDEVNGSIGKGTQDSLRKTIFVDLHRMGLIYRYGPTKAPIVASRSLRQRIKYVSLSEQGLRLVRAQTIDEQYYIFSKALDKLLLGVINELLSLLRDPELNLKRVEIHEFMFFVSAIGSQTSFNISRARCIELIQSFRRLSRMQRKRVVDTLDQMLEPENFDGDKTSMRDYDNWHNEAEQIYSLLDQTVYFEVRKTEHESLLFLRQGKIRSFSQKMRYFQIHRVMKTPGFELHHVVPLGWSESEEQFKLFDDWQNMVYINAFQHAQITQNRNRNVVMSADEDNIVLSDYSENQVYLTHRQTILYDSKHQPTMLEYNKQLLDVVD